MSKDNQQARIQEINRQITEEVRGFLLDNDITQVELSQFIGVNRWTMNRILSEEDYPLTISRAVALAYFMGKALVVKLEDLDDPSDIHLEYKKYWAKEETTP